VVRSRRADLEWISDLVERGGLRPVVEMVVPFGEAVQGLRRLESLAFLVVIALMAAGACGPAAPVARVTGRHAGKESVSVWHHFRKDFSLNPFFEPERLARHGLPSKVRAFSPPCFQTTS